MTLLKNSVKKYIIILLLILGILIIFIVFNISREPSIITGSKQTGKEYVKKTYGDYYEMASYEIVTTPPTVLPFIRNFEYVAMTFKDVNQIEADLIIYVEGSEVLYDSYKNKWFYEDLEAFVLSSSPS